MRVRSARWGWQVEVRVGLEVPGGEAWDTSEVRSGRLGFEWEVGVGGR